MRRAYASAVDSLAVRLPATASTVRRRAVVLALLLGGGLTMSLGLVLSVAAPAVAHDSLVSSSPADGAVLPAPPPIVELTFSGEVTDLGSALVIEDESGAAVQNAPPTIEGTVIRSPLPPDLGPGTYLVRWRVVAEDGHPIEGSFGFSVSDDAPAGGGTQVPTDGSSDSPVAGSTDTPGAGDSTPPGDLADGTVSEDGRVSLGPVVGALIGLGALAGVVVALVRRKRT